MSNQRKKRILLVNECSVLSTGFSVIGMEWMSRLYKTGKYELFELGSYVRPEDQRLIHVPWPIQAGMPRADDEQANQMFMGNRLAQFGEHLFEHVCLEFRPDIVLAIRDRWMDEFILRSPFRKYFKFYWMLTIDGQPQRLEWIDDYTRVDRVFTYSRFGKETIEKESPGLIKVEEILRPGVNHEVFRPLDKAKVRDMLGLRNDVSIVLSVMRNQRRKLFPDLMEAFSDFLAMCSKKGTPGLAKKTFLWLHTSYPDVGFDIGRFIMQLGLGHKVLVTYQCQACNTFYPSFYGGELSVCKRCGQKAAFMPNTAGGIGRNELALIYNAADLYVQYAISEGYSCPCAEAKACGLPVMAVDYSAMVDHAHEPGGIPLKVKRFFYEPVIETEQERALPDNADLTRKLHEFFTSPKEERVRLGQQARQVVTELHTFERSTKLLEKVIDKEICPDHEHTWLSPERRLCPMNVIPANFGRSTEEFVDTAIDQILGRPEWKNTFWRQEMVKAIQVGYYLDNGGRQPMSREMFLEKLVQIAQKHNAWENARVTKFYPAPAGHIQFELV